jgi:hypothetical protein
MPSELRERLQEAARRSGLSMNAFMVELIRDRLDPASNCLYENERIERRARELTVQLAARLLEHHVDELAAQVPQFRTHDNRSH